MSKVYLFIKQRNVWYETTLPSASHRSCIPPPPTHVVICKKRERQRERQTATVVTLSLTEEHSYSHVVMEEIYHTSVSSHLNLFLKEEFDKYIDFHHLLVFFLPLG